MRGEVVEAPPGVEFDPTACAERLTASIRDAIRELGRRGAVVAVSGGIDSSVVAALCVRAPPVRGAGVRPGTVEAPPGVAFDPAV